MVPKQVPPVAVLMDMKLGEELEGGARLIHKPALGFVRKLEFANVTYATTA